MLTETEAPDAIADLAEELGAPCWRDLIEKDDRTSPEEYPDHALISQDELIEYIKVSLDMARDPKALPRAMWQPIVTAPTDGTVLDLFVEDQGRVPDCHWGHTEHNCGEAGQYCDSDWHAEQPGWCWGTLNEQITGATHWMPRPADPV